MGWKSTIHISRKKALELIQQRILTATDKELAEAVEAVGYGDNAELPFYGRNFIISDEAGEREEYERLKEKYGSPE